MNKREKERKERREREREERCAGEVPYSAAFFGIVVRRDIRSGAAEGRKKYPKKSLEDMAPENESPEIDLFDSLEEKNLGRLP